MDTQKPLTLSYWLFGLALLLFLSLLLLPTTHWMAAQQTKMLFTTPNEYAVLLKDLGIKEIPFQADPAAAERAQAEVAQRNPNDYLLQLAAAQAYIPPSETGMGEAYYTARLSPTRTLKERFPDHRAALSAHALRYAATTLRIHRDDEVETYNSGKPSNLAPPIQYTPPTNAFLAAYDHDAAEGEQFDPDNAFFPLMRSIGLFAAHRDEEGVAAVLRAGQKSHYNDYTGEEATAAWKRFETTFGKQSATIRICVYSAMLYPHYSQIRSLARFAVYKAAKAEEAGHTEQGLAIRHAMMHASDLLRKESQNSIGPLVGIACTRIMTMRPGGVLNKYPNLSDDQRMAQRQEDYYAYLRKIGHASEADWSRQVLDAGPKTQELLKAGMKQSQLGLQQTGDLLTRWIQDIVLLANTLELLLLGGVMLLLTKLRRDAGSAPIIIALTLCACFLVLALMAHWSEAFVTFLRVIQELSSGGDSSSGPALNPFLFSAMFVKISVIGLSLLGPMLVLVVLGFLRLIRPKESGSVVASGLRTGGLAVALGLMVAYGVALWVTQQKEMQAHTALDRMAQSEPRYLAEIQGKPWPP